MVKDAERVQGRRRVSGGGGGGGGGGGVCRRPVSSNCGRVDMVQGFIANEW